MRNRRPSILVLIASLSFISPVWADQATQQAPGPLPSNFHQVTPWLYRGAQPSNDDLRTLAQMGVRTIVDLRMGTRSRKASLAKELGMDYVALPMKASRGVSEPDVDALFKVLDDPSRHPVYVHCLAGKHRTGVMIALYRVMREGMSPDDAYAEMERCHFGGRYPILRDYVYARAASQAASTAVATGAAPAPPTTAPSAVGAVAALP